MAKPNRDRVFLSYAHEDLDTVRRIYSGLKERQLNVWFDKVDFGPGRWKGFFAQNREISSSVSKPLLRLPLWTKIDFETGPYWICNLLNIPNILNWKNQVSIQKVRCSQTYDTKGFRG